jgi:hypothetical protein
MTKKVRIEPIKARKVKNVPYPKSMSEGCLAAARKTQLEFPVRSVAKSSRSSMASGILNEISIQFETDSESRAGISSTVGRSRGKEEAE